MNRARRGGAGNRCHDANSARGRGARARGTLGVVVLPQPRAARAAELRLQSPGGRAERARPAHPRYLSAGLSRL